MQSGIHGLAIGARGLPDAPCSGHRRIADWSADCTLSSGAWGQPPPAALSQINTQPASFPTIPPSHPRGEGHRAILIKEIRHTPLLWMLVFAPAVLVAEKAAPEAHTVLFVLAVLAIVPLAALLSHATEAVAAKTGDAVGGLLNATLGNLTELIIAVTALHAGQYMLVKASIAGAIVTNALFMLGASLCSAACATTCRSSTGPVRASIPGCC